MEKAKKGGLAQLEENLMLIPLAVAIVLTLACFVLQFGGEATTETVTFLTQLSYYAYTWVCCIGLGVCVRDNKHLNVEFFGGMYPKSVKKFWDIFNRILGFLIIAAMFVGSFLLVKNALASGEMNASAPGLPVAVVYFAPLVGFGLGLIRSVQSAVKGGK